MNDYGERKLGSIRGRSPKCPLERVPPRRHWRDASSQPPVNARPHNSTSELGPSSRPLDVLPRREPSHAHKIMILIVMGCGGRRLATLDSEWKWNPHGAPYPVHAKKIRRWGVVPHGMGITVTWAWRDRPEYYYLLELFTVQSHPQCYITVWPRAASLYFSFGNTAANTTLPTSPPNALFSGRECAFGYSLSNAQ